MRTVSLDQFLTVHEIDAAIKLYHELHNTGRFASVLSTSIITPSIERINTALGQENSPLYLAYAVEHTLNQLDKTK